MQGCYHWLISIAYIADEGVKSRSEKDFKGLNGLRLKAKLSLLPFNQMPYLGRFAEIQRSAMTFGHKVSFLVTCLLGFCCWLGTDSSLGAGWVLPGMCFSQSWAVPHLLHPSSSGTQMECYSSEALFGKTALRTVPCSFKLRHYDIFTQRSAWVNEHWKLSMS